MKNPKPLAIAKAKYIRMSPRKMRLVADKIRGKTYLQALYILKNSTKTASGPIWQTIASAAANAIYTWKKEHMKKEVLEKEDLLIEEIYINGGGMLKRTRPRQKGKAFQIQKKISHITVTVGTRKTFDNSLSQNTLLKDGIKWTDLLTVEEEKSFNQDLLKF